MALTNAERQRLFRQRAKGKPKSTGVLTPDLVAARNAVMAEAMYPTPEVSDDKLPTFLGWNRYDWSEAPEAMLEFFGMRVAYDGWQSEMKVMDRRSSENSDRISAQAEAIVAECGEGARKVWHKYGSGHLITEYKEHQEAGKRYRPRD